MIFRGKKKSSHNFQVFIFLSFEYKTNKYTNLAYVSESV